MIDLTPSWDYRDDTDFPQTVTARVETKERPGDRVTTVRGLMAFFGPQIDRIENPYVRANTIRAMSGSHGKIADRPQYHVRDISPRFPMEDDWRLISSYRQNSYQIGLPDPDCWPAIPTDDVMALLRQIRDQLGLWAPGRGPDTEEARDA